MRYFFVFSLLFVFLFACQNKSTPAVAAPNPTNEIKYASGISLENFPNFTLVEVRNPWPNSTEIFQYVLHRKGTVLPDSLQKFTAIQIPLQSVIVTSTTHIPSLTLLGVSDKLVGFPNHDYISSPEVRAHIAKGKIREVGSNLSLNTEVILDIQPEALVVFGINGERDTHKIIEKAGIPLIYHGDWMEENPLGRAEWIKLFGALFDQQAKAQRIFNQIETDYLQAKALAKAATARPTVMAGAIYEDQWFLPQGNSWAAQFIKDANAHYLWADTTGNGSLALSYETVLETAQNADFWLGPAQFTTYNDMLNSHPNYQYFKPFINQKIYTFSSKKGATGGIIYYEEASARPDLVLKDVIKILHPTLLETHSLYFFEPLK